MLKRLFGAVLCSLIVAARIHAQEVIVARESKSGHSTNTPVPSEQVFSESPRPAPHKSRAHEKKSVPATLTLEEMRAAGARAAEAGNDRSVSQSSKTREPEVQTAPVPNPTFVETPRPAKREAASEQRRSSHSSKSRGTNIEDLGPIRPTLMESGREPPSPSPSGR